MRVLICDDDSVVGEALGIYLEREGFAYQSALDGEQALRLFKQDRPDFVILDIMMPGKSGFDVCREMRKLSDVPIIMLTAKGEEIDKIIGFELGADDYIIKPFSAREVLARIKAIRRRLAEGKNADQVIRLGEMEISIANYLIRCGGHTVEATPKEVEILFLLAGRRGQVFTRQQILDAVWGYDYCGDTRAVDTHMKRIRAKLPEEYGSMIKTIYGVGYKIEVTE